MKLKEYLDHYGMRYNVFAKKLGVTGPTFSKFLKEGYNPTASLIDKIEQLTNKEVKYKDWIDGVHQESVNKTQDCIE